MLVEATDRVLPEIDPKLADYALQRAARARHGHPPRHDPRGGHRGLGRALDRRADPDPHGRLDRGRRRRTRASSSSASSSTSAGASPSTITWRSRGLERRLRRRRLRCGPRPRRRPLPADRPARDPPGEGRGAQHGGRPRRRRADDVHLPQPRRLRQPRPVQGRRDAWARRSAARRSPASPPGGRPAPTTSARCRASPASSAPSPTGRSACLRPRHAEVGSIGHPAPLSDAVYVKGGSHRPIGTGDPLDD